MYRLVVVPSPTCASETKSRQPKTCLPSPPIISPIKSKHLKASLVRRRCIPSTTPRRCWIPHRNAPANHASRNNGPSPAPPAINPPSNAAPHDHKIMRNQQTSHQLAASCTPIFTSFIVAHLALYAPGRCRNAQCDQGACWDFPSSGPVDA